MKSLGFSASVLFTLLISVNPVWSQDFSTVRTTCYAEADGPSKFNDLDMHINPQVGLSSFEYSKNAGGGQQKVTGGVTAEFGSAARRLETGWLWWQNSADATMKNGTTERITTNYITLPVMAKLRVLSARSQSWYLKLGVTTALRTSSSNNDATNAADVLGGLGLAARFPATRNSDFIIDTTYNRGLLQAVNNPSGANYNQGFVVLAGLSIRL